MAKMIGIVLKVMTRTTRIMILVKEEDCCSDKRVVFRVIHGYIVVDDNVDCADHSNYVGDNHNTGNKVLIAWLAQMVI